MVHLPLQNVIGWHFDEQKSQQRKSQLRNIHTQHDILGFAVNDRRKVSHSLTLSRRSSIIPLGSHANNGARWWSYEDDALGCQLLGKFGIFAQETIPASHE
jgi:hypothetical protein